VSVGAALVTPFARLEAGEDALALLGQYGFQAIALSPAAATPLSQLVRPPKAALLLGAEGPGLPKDMLDRARAVAIPMAAGLDSLNVATASGIALHHLAFGAI
jgi:tRNA G18 (ribose-2'-O)-methylase SpoU